MATKEQEIKALNKIKKIVTELGTDSYLASAFDGCFEVAEQNIENDFMMSLKERAEIADERLNRIKELYVKMNHLEKQLEKEQEWKDYVFNDNVSQKDYEKLVTAGGTKFLTDKEAKDLLYGWFGFARDRINIVKSVPMLQINRHGEIRKIGVYERVPSYNATDWHYIRFNCDPICYELYNDDLRFFTE